MLAAVWSATGLSSSHRAKTEIRKNFLWDQCIMYIGLTWILLTVLAIGEAFFGNGYEVTCLTPDEFSRDQTTYISRLCSESTRIMRLMPLLFLCQTLLVLGPHLMWENTVGPKLTQFFSMIPLIARYRNGRTGLFDIESIEIVKRLRNDFQKETDASQSYVRKLKIQLILSVVSLTTTNFVYLFYQPSDSYFGHSFSCKLPRRAYNKSWFESDTWQLCHANATCSADNPPTVPCTYSFTATLLPLWVVNIVLQTIAAVLMISALVWCNKPHWKELDFKGKAEFLYVFCANKGNYRPNKSWKMKCLMKTNLDLFLLMLFASDKGQGTTCQELLIELLLDKKWTEDKKLHFSSLTQKRQTSKTPLTTKKDFHEFLMSQVKENLPEKCCFELGLHLFCGSKGAIVCLAQYCKEFVAVDFNSHVDAFQEQEKRTVKKTEADSSRSIRAAFKRNEMQRTQNVLYSTNHENIKFYCVSIDYMSQNPQDIGRLTVALRGNPSSDEDSITYNLVVVTQLEETEEEQDFELEQPGTATSARIRQKRLRVAPRILSARNLLKNLETEFNTDTTFIFCFRSSKEIEALIEPLKCVNPEAKRRECSTFECPSSSLKIACHVHKGCTPKQWAEVTNSRKVQKDQNFRMSRISEFSV